MDIDEPSFTDQLRRAIVAPGLSRSAICKRTGVHQSTMSRLMAGAGGLKNIALDRLGELLNLELAKGEILDDRD
jgi:transcriptional regulator with XRE-family HTH domain